MSNLPPDFLTLQETADRLGTVPRTVIRLHRRGILRAVKHGKTCPLIFRQVDVARYLEALTTPTAPPPPRKGS